MLQFERTSIKQRWAPWIKNLTSRHVLSCLDHSRPKKREYIIGYSPHVFITPNFWVKHTQTISKQSKHPLVSWSHLRLLLHAAKGISSWSLDQGEGQISTGIGQTLVGSLVTGRFGTSNQARFRTVRKAGRWIAVCVCLLLIISDFIAVMEKQSISKLADLEAYPWLQS